MPNKKILLVGDYVFSNDEMMQYFKYFEEYGAELLTFEDSSVQTPEEFQEEMLKIEQEGPEGFVPSQGLISAIKDVEILIVHLTVIPSSLIQAANRIELIGVLRGGYENVNVAAAKERGVVVVNSPGRSSESVSDFTIGLMISESKNIVRGSIALQEGGWPKEFYNFPYTHNLRGQTVGLIGFGAVGARVAKKLMGFDTKVIVYDPFVPSDTILRAGCRPVDMDELLIESDIISLHARLTKDTHHMLGTKEFEKMKPTVFIINTARAGLIDESVLVDALKNKKIGGAAIDVFSVEPIPKDFPMLELENVTLTPHLAGVSCDTKQDALEILGREIERYIKNEKLLYVCN